MNLNVIRIVLFKIESLEFLGYFCMYVFRLCDWFCICLECFIVFVLFGRDIEIYLDFWRFVFWLESYKIWDKIFDISFKRIKMCIGIFRG